MDLLKKVAVMVFIFLAIPSLVFGAVSGFVTLKYGQKNNSEVRELQTFLKSQGLYNGPVTGNFLTLTRASLKNFQKKYGLKQTGLLDESTLKKITEIQNLQNNSQSTNNLQENQTTINTSSSLDITKLPLGDNKYSTTSAQRGYIYLCSVGGGMEGGAQVKGPWITGDTWDSTKKTQVSGDVSWPNAKLNIKTSGESRIFTGNGLLVNHNTGQYPINSSDPAYKYDKNPNSISEQNTSITVPLNPTIQTKPGCMYGMVGVATTGVLIFNGFDAGKRDAVAYEVQDKCDGHPEKTGQYHYHDLSRCISDSGTGHSGLIGYAFDGFGIFGLRGESGKELTNQDLDECHGHTHEILWESKKVSMYHYHSTREFPYTVGCFKGKSYEPRPSGGGEGMSNPNTGVSTGQRQQFMPNTGNQLPPPMR